jgi:altronate hydrolase
MVLFTTGRGTPLGGAVPTLKISSNNNIAVKKPHWIDFNAFGDNKAQICEDLLSLVTEVANGKETNNETHGYREIAIFKDGVTL